MIDNFFFILFVFECNFNSFENIKRYFRKLIQKALDNIFSNPEKKIKRKKKKDSQLGSLLYIIKNNGKFTNKKI